MLMPTHRTLSIRGRSARRPSVVVCLLVTGSPPRGAGGQVIAAWPPFAWWSSGGLGVGVGQGAVADAARDLLPVLAGQAALGPLGLHLGQVHAEVLLDRLQVGLCCGGCHRPSSWLGAGRPVAGFYQVT